MQVPAAVKRKIGKRESSQLMSPDAIPDFDEVKGFKPGLSKDKSAGKVTIGPSSTSKDGSWKKVVGVLRDDGYFRVFTEVRCRPLLNSNARMLIARRD